MADRMIWKYQIPINVLSASFTTVQHIPAGARLLHLGQQGGNVALWYEIPDEDAEIITHRYQLFGTGAAAIGDHLDYLGTVQIATQSTELPELVLHVYEVAR